MDISKENYGALNFITTVRKMRISFSFFYSINGFTAYFRPIISVLTWWFSMKKKQGQKKTYLDLLHKLICLGILRSPTTQPFYFRFEILWMFG